MLARPRGDLMMVHEDPAGARAWIAKPIPSAGGVPLQLLQTHEGYEQAQHPILQLAWGACAWSFGGLPKRHRRIAPRTFPAPIVTSLNAWFQAGDAQNGLDTLGARQGGYRLIQATFLSVFLFCNAAVTIASRS